MYAVAGPLGIFNPIKAAGKGVKAVGKGVAKGAKAVGKGVKAVGNVAVKSAAVLAKYNPITLATLVAASALMTPLRLAFRSVATKRASALARSRGRSSPNAQDKKEAIAWGFDKVKKGLPLKLGAMAVLALKTTKGVSLAGVDFSELGAIGVDDIAVVASAATAAITALEKTLHFSEGLASLVKPKPAAPPAEVPDEETMEGILPSGSVGAGVLFGALAVAAGVGVYLTIRS